MLFSALGLIRQLRVALVFAVIVLAGFLLERALSARSQDEAPQPAAQTSPIFTPSHKTVYDAVREFFGARSKPVQPIAYTHKVHLANGLQCTDCHVGVDQGPDARIPSVNFCMTCHQVIATDKPEIKKLAAYRARGEDIPWQRVYGFEPSAHVKFNHAPHIRAGVDCAKCHGDMRTLTVAERKVDHTMGFCIECHRENHASVDCVTCHF
ncbi:MAG TPA: cytochrome c3 family protein [Candidatus Acidoferrales bacterium]|nr:cytochrome c3 family protein [Candidatus Acidoferrales bacterium]